MQVVNKETSISSVGGPSLNVIHLHYRPRRDIFYKAIQFRDFIFNQSFVKELFNQISFDVFNPTELRDVTFRAFKGQISAILSNDAEELRTITELLVNHRNSGSFDGEILIDGVDDKLPYKNCLGFVPKKSSFEPGLTFSETLKFAARLRIRSLGQVNIKERVDEVLKIMDLFECKNERVENYSERSSEMRRLIIAAEIVGLPPLIVLENPTLGLDPAVGLSVFSCLRTLANRGHIVLCSMMRPSAQLFAQVDNAIVLNEGKTIFSSSKQNIIPFFTTAGYQYKEGTNLSDFLLDIAAGTERPGQQRVAATSDALQEAFERSAYFSNPILGLKAVYALPRQTFIIDYFISRCWLCSSLSDLFTICIRHIYYILVIVHRSLVVKFRNVEQIKQSIGGSLLIASFMGYLQYGHADFGLYCLTIARIPYVNAANSASILFFGCMLTFSFQGLAANTIAQRVKTFRHEQKLGYHSAVAFIISSMVSDIPFVIASSVVFCSVYYFMTRLSVGSDNFIFFVKVITMLAFVGTASLYLFASILRKEIRVRDAFLFCLFGLLVSSGYAFQIPFMDNVVSTLSGLSPIRWAFEALMHWKFSQYVDGLVFLEPYAFDTFDPDTVFQILLNFIIFSLVVTFLGLLPTVYTLKRQPQIRSKPPRNDKRRVISQDGADDHVIVMPPEAARPLIFNRETSITSMSKLSINVSKNADVENLDSLRGPTVTFNNVHYKIRNNHAPSGYMSLLNGVSGQFDWGKLGLVLGARASGRSSLLHILAGDKGLASTISGEIRYNESFVDPDIPLWQRCALVESQDEQHRDLTVKEVVTFAMLLRCPSLQAVSLVEENVTRTLELLRLDVVGSRKCKTLNAGERRRVSLAEEIVHGPGLVFIDEPFNQGMDISDEAVIMATFREMVNQDRTVIASVHNPSSRIIDLFDKVLLLSKGNVIFHGPASEAQSYFISSPFGFSPLGYENPADFLTDISGGYLLSDKGMSISAEELSDYFKVSKYGSKKGDKMAQVRESDNSDDVSVSALVDKASSKKSGSVLGSIMNSLGLGGPKDTLKQDLLGNDELSNSHHLNTSIDQKNRLQVRGYPIANPLYLIPYVIWGCLVSFFHFFWHLPRTNLGVSLLKAKVLLQRSFLAMFRRTKLYTTAIVTHILLAVVIGWVVGKAYPAAYSTASLNGVGPLLLILVNIQFVYYMFRLNQVFLKEHSRQLYSVSLNWAVTSIPLYLLRVLNAIIYTAILYTMTDLTSHADIGYYMASNTLLVLVAVMFVECILNYAPSLSSAYVTVTAFMLIFFVFSGLYVKEQTLPYWLDNITVISPIHWTIEGNFLHTYEHDTTTFPSTAAFNSKQIFLDLFSWYDTKEFCLEMLFVNVLVYRGLALVLSCIASVAQKGGRKFRKEENISKSLNSLD